MWHGISLFQHREKSWCASKLRIIMIVPVNDCPIGEYKKFVQLVRPKRFRYVKNIFRRSGQVVMYLSIYFSYEFETGWEPYKFINTFLHSHEYTIYRMGNFRWVIFLATRAYLSTPNCMRCYLHFTCTSTLDYKLKLLMNI